MTVLAAGWWNDAEALAREVEGHGSYAAASRVHDVPVTTLKSAAARHKLPGRRPPPKDPTEGKGEQPGVTVAGDTATVVSDPTGAIDLGDVDQLLRDRGLEPDDWTVERLTVNEWDAYAGRDEPFGEPRIVKLRQLKVFLKRRVSVDWLFPAVEVAQRWAWPPAPSRRPVDTLTVVCGDQQADYQDEGLHEAFLRWLADVQPESGVLAGDTLDLPTISRHPDRPHWNTTPQRCLNVGFQLLSDYRDASPGTGWSKLRGNHDWRLESELLTRAERMFGLTPAEIPGEEQVPGYSIRRLLHLDALGISLIGREGDKWELAELELSEGVYVRHKPPSKARLTRLHRCVIAGDSHRQSIENVTVWHDEEPHVITLMQVGCMCRTDGLGYTEHPDWQPGFGTVAIGADGTLGFDLATWRGGRLTWRGESW